MSSPASLNCVDAACLTSCHRAFVSNSCHFSERPQITFGGAVAIQPPVAGGEQSGSRWDLLLLGDEDSVDENYVLRIPDNIPLEAAAPLLCAGITMYSPLRHWNAGAGQAGRDHGPGRPRPQASRPKKAAMSKLADTVFTMRSKVPSSVPNVSGSLVA